METMEQIAEAIAERARAIAAEKGRATVFIDGRCASGKSTLARRLGELLGANVFHVDDFFLPFEQKTAERLSRPGENVDHERFLSEVLIPHRENVPFAFRPYDCSSGTLAPPVSVVPTSITVVEGVYCCRPELYPFGDLHLFLTVSPEEQMRRILARNGERMAERFRLEWIPMEEAYFSAFSVEARCEATYVLADHA